MNFSEIKKVVFFQMLFTCGFFSHWLLFIFGYSIVFIPLMYFFPFMYIIFLIIDWFQFPIFKYTITGVLGELILVANVKSYGLISLIVGVLFYFYFQPKKLGRLYEYLERPVQFDHIKVDFDFSKLFRNFQLQARVLNKYIGPFVITYTVECVPQSLRRFSLLSADFSEDIPKCRIVVDVDHTYIEVPHGQLLIPNLKNVSKNIQPNVFMFLTSDGRCITQDLLDNFYFSITTNVQYSLLFQLFITGNHIVWLHGIYFEFGETFYEPINMFLRRVEEEMERRYKIIMPVTKDIYTYRQHHNLSFLFIILHEYNDWVAHIMLNGPKVGIFVHCYYHDTKKNKNGIYISNTESFLVCEYDAVLKSGHYHQRIAIPEITHEDYIKFVGM